MNFIKTGKNNNKANYYLVFTASYYFHYVKEGDRNHTYTALFLQK